MTMHLRPRIRSKPIEILLVEDSPIDIKMIEEALSDDDVKSNLHIVNDGDDAIEFVRKSGKFATVPRPDIVLLDLNFPKRDGREVLAEIKSDPVLRSIPVVILTTSKAERDVASVYDLHANCYVNKPIDMNHFLDVIKSISKFWLTVVALPSQEE